MSLASLAWLWFALAISCVLAGMALTGKRVAETPSAKQTRPRTSQPAGARGEQKTLVCSRCAQSLEPDARFCGTCGLYLSQQQPARQKVTRR
jgi:uncharacterized paraquat-inducible protein A